MTNDLINTICYKISNEHFISWINLTTESINPKPFKVFSYPSLPIFKQFLGIKLQSEAFPIILQLLTFHMVFPAFSKDHFHMTQQCIKLVLNLEYTIEQKLFSISSKKAEFFHSEWCAISLVKLTCLDQTILPETVGKSLTLLILQAVLWMYWTYKQTVAYPC